MSGRKRQDAARITRNGGGVYIQGGKFRRLRSGDLEVNALDRVHRRAADRAFKTEIHARGFTRVYRRIDVENNNGPSRDPAYVAVPVVNRNRLVEAAGLAGEGDGRVVVKNGELIRGGSERPVAGQVRRRHGDHDDFILFDRLVGKNVCEDVRYVDIPRERESVSKRRIRQEGVVILSEALQGSLRNPSERREDHLARLKRRRTLGRNAERDLDAPVRQLGRALRPHNHSGHAALAVRAVLDGHVVARNPETGKFNGFCRILIKNVERLGFGGNIAPRRREGRRRFAHPSIQREGDKLVVLVGILVDKDAERMTGRPLGKGEVQRQNGFGAVIEDGDLVACVAPRREREVQVFRQGVGDINAENGLDPAGGGVNLEQRSYGVFDTLHDGGLLVRSQAVDTGRAQTLAQSRCERRKAHEVVVRHDGDRTRQRARFSFVSLRYDGSGRQLRHRHRHREGFGAFHDVVVDDG